MVSRSASPRDDEEGLRFQERREFRPPLVAPVLARAAAARMKGDDGWGSGGRLQTERNPGLFQVKRDLFQGAGELSGGRNLRGFVHPVGALQKRLHPGLFQVPGEESIGVIEIGNDQCEAGEVVRKARIELGAGREKGAIAPCSIDRTASANPAAVAKDAIPG